MPRDDCTHYLGGSSWLRGFPHTLELKLAVQIEVVGGWAGPSERQDDVSCVISNESFYVLNVFGL
jgi:hypothetical protein